MFTILELFYDCAAYEIFVADPKGIRDRNRISQHHKHDGTKWKMNVRLLIKMEWYKKGNNHDRMTNLGFLFGDNDILLGSRGGYNLNPMSILTMSVEGCHVLVPPATNGTPNSHIQMFPDVSQDRIQIGMS